MQRKIRELVKELKKAGFVNRGGKRGHQNFKHKDGAILIISGKLGADAKPYQEKIVKLKILESINESK